MEISCNAGHLTVSHSEMTAHPALEPDSFLISPRGIRYCCGVTTTNVSCFSLARTPPLLRGPLRHLASRTARRHIESLFSI